MDGRTDGTTSLSLSPVCTYVCVCLSELQLTAAKDADVAFLCCCCCCCCLLFVFSNSSTLLFSSQLGKELLTCSKPSKLPRSFESSFSNSIKQSPSETVDLSSPPPPFPPTRLLLHRILLKQKKTMLFNLPIGSHSYNVTSPLELKMA